jgi:hypothetical protein
MLIRAFVFGMFLGSSRHCSSWSDGTFNATAVIGNGLTATWTANTTDSCSSIYSLLCIEQ